MAQQPFILVYGRDLSLLETRCWVLQGAGFHVRTTMDFEEAIRIFRAGPPDLTILCHSLTPEQRKTVLDTTRAACPSRKVLILASGPDASQGAGETFLDCLEGPRRLLATIEDLLAQPGA